jgi:hypothetical protein
VGVLENKTTKTSYAFGVCSLHSFAVVVLFFGFGFGGGCFFFSVVLNNQATGVKPTDLLSLLKLLRKRQIVWLADS